MMATKQKGSLKVAYSHQEDAITLLYNTLYVKGVPCYARYIVGEDLHELYVDRKYVPRARLIINRVLNGGINYGDLDRVMPFVYTPN